MKLVSEERLWELAAEQCHKATAAWNGIPCKGCPGGCMLGRIAVATANAALAELGVVRVEEVSLGELLMPFGGGDVQDGAILIRAKKEGEE